MARAKARGWAKSVGVGVVASVCMYIYNRLLRTYMYIISVYMYIYTTRGENFLILNRTRNAWEKSGGRKRWFT